GRLRRSALLSMPKAANSLSTTLHLLHRASQVADAAFMRHLPPEADLTPRQLGVLEAVAANSGLSQTDIMAATGIDRSSIAELVKRLIKHGCSDAEKKPRCPSLRGDAEPGRPQPR